MPDDTAFTRKVTTGPLPASRKVYVPGTAHPDLRVAMREIDRQGIRRPRHSLPVDLAWIHTVRGA